MDKDLESLSTQELEKIVHAGENLHIPTSRASRAQRILESRRHSELVDATKKLNPVNSVIKDSENLTIFYSWQSDLPNRTNRGLIEDALTIAIKRISDDETIKILARLDKDTAGVPGSPNIATTILGKIDCSFLVIADISIINARSKYRPTPNPNVLYELGYAVKSLGMNNVVMVQNLAFGDTKKLPFDLKLHRILPYECKQGQSVAQSKKDLTDKLERAIRLALGTKSKTPINKNTSLVEEFQEILIADKSPIVLESRLKTLADKIFDDLHKSNLYKYSEPVTLNEFIKRKSEAENTLKDIIFVFINLGRWVKKPQLEVVIRQFDKLLRIPQPDNYNEIWENLAHYPGLILLFALGLGAVYNDNIELLVSIFKLEAYNHSSGKNEPIIHNTSVFNVFRHYKDLTKDNRYFPGSEELFNLFKSYFEDITPEKYEDIFDSLEYLITLVYGEWEIMRSASHFWVPTGSYAYRVKRRKIWEVISSSFIKDVENWKYLRCFVASRTELAKNIAATNEFIEKVSEKVSW